MLFDYYYFLCCCLEDRICGFSHVKDFIPMTTLLQGIFIRVAGLIYPVSNLQNFVLLFLVHLRPGLIFSY